MTKIKYILYKNILLIYVQLFVSYLTYATNNQTINIEWYDEFTLDVIVRDFKAKYKTIK